MNFFFINMNISERLYSKINVTQSKCWEFTGALRNGYGAIKHKGKIFGAHRLSYELKKGLIPDGVLVCHKCDNRKCVNPEHLFLGTYKDNMQDCKNKGRLVVPVGCNFKKGDYPSNAKHSLKDAIEFKNKILNRGDKTLISIAKELNISYQYARDISCGRILKDK